MSPGFDSNALKFIFADIYKNLYNPSMKIKPLKFIASSLDDLRNFPDEARRAVGFELYAIQYAFQKKTRKTSRQDIDLARQRYKHIGG